jgi:hypothetical protein
MEPRAETRRLRANRPRGIRWSDHLSAGARPCEGCRALTPGKLTILRLQLRQLTVSATKCLRLVRPTEAERQGHFSNLPID